MDVGQHSPHPKTQQRHSHGGHLMQAHILPLSNFKDTGEEPSSLHKNKNTKHTHQTRVENTTLYSDGITHSKQHRSKGVQHKHITYVNTTRFEKKHYL